jgi:hypothetical protein
MSQSQSSAPDHRRVLRQTDPAAAQARRFSGIIDLQAAINRYLAETNDDPRPFIWTADPDAIIEKVRRGKQALESIQLACPTVSPPHSSSAGFITSPLKSGKSQAQGLMVKNPGRASKGCAGRNPWVRDLGATRKSAFVGASTAVLCWAVRQEAN